jgi:hypothetical protein
MTPTFPQKITFGELRASGVRDVLIYCRDHHSSHHITISADRWPDRVRLSDIEPGRNSMPWLCARAVCVLSSMRCPGAAPPLPAT